MFHDSCWSSNAICSDSEGSTRNYSPCPELPWLKSGSLWASVQLGHRTACGRWQYTSIWAMPGSQISHMWLEVTTQTRQTSWRFKLLRMQGAFGKNYGGEALLLAFPMIISKFEWAVRLWRSAESPAALHWGTTGTEHCSYGMTQWRPHPVQAWGEMRELHHLQMAEKKNLNQDKEF